MGAAIALEAQGWIGTPFHWQGRVKQVGCDCKGLIAGVFAALSLPEAASLEALADDYGQVVPVARLQAGLAALFLRVTQSQDGDIVLLVLGGKPQHLGLIAGERLIHCYPSGPAQVVSAPYGHAWRSATHSLWRRRSLLVEGLG